MEINKEKTAFLNIYVNYKDDSRKIQFDEETEQFMWRKYNVSDTEVEYISIMNQRWYAWLACAKRKVVPEGFVLVPKLLSDELADELASDAFNNIQSMFDYEHRGSTATHREQIRLRWCTNKAREFQENYKIMIEVQEQSHD
ncbi:hypothetical protein [Acinetobacter sp. ANC 3832]|uniref:hypothetical protein n=1 Tax=Acinetobacter sp. ANC 3832 TaxID=1977874 RepID=UPI001D17D1F7|nr:hypothetical protein [Acinetobacter sp. ANC 3832]